MLQLFDEVETLESWSQWVTVLVSHCLSVALSLCLTEALNHRAIEALSHECTVFLRHWFTLSLYHWFIVPLRQWFTVTVLLYSWFSVSQCRVIFEFFYWNVSGSGTSDGWEREDHWMQRCHFHHDLQCGEWWNCPACTAAQTGSSGAESLPSGRQSGWDIFLLTSFSPQFPSTSQFSFHTTVTNLSSAAVTLNIPCVCVVDSRWSSAEWEDHHL